MGTPLIPIKHDVRRLETWLFIALLWLNSGAFVFVENIDHKRGEIFLFLLAILLLILTVINNLARRRLVPFAMGGWSKYLICFFVMSIVITALTSMYIDKDTYQISRSYFRYFFFIIIPYIVFSARMPADLLIKNILLINFVLFALVILTWVTGVQIFASSFTDFEPGDGDIQEMAEGGVRLIPYGLVCAMFAVVYGVLRITQKSLTLRLRERNFLMLSVVAGMAILLLTFTRSVIAPTVIVLMASFVKIGGLTGRSGKSILLFFFTLIALLLVDYLLGGVISSVLIDRFSLALERGDAWRGLEIEEALETISRNIIFGIGLGAPYTNIMSSLATEGYDVNANFDIHNAYLSMLVSYGLIGFIVFLFGGYKFLKIYLPTGEKERLFVLACKLLMAITLIQGFYTGPFFVSRTSFWYAFFLSYAIYLSVGNRSGPRSGQPNPDTLLRPAS